MENRVQEELAKMENAQLLAQTHATLLDSDVELIQYADSRKIAEHAL